MALIVDPEIEQNKRKTLKAFKFQQRTIGAPDLVVFHAPVGDILKFSIVDELGPNSRGPQRQQKEARVVAIKKFLEADPKNTIPTALVLAFSTGSTSFADGAHGGVLEIDWSKGPAATIVDGQHRLFGVDSFDPNIEMPVIGLLDADEEERAFQFLVINNKSSKVPATHVKALLARMQNGNLSRRLRGAKLAFDVAGIKDVDLVNSDPDSPFFENIDWSTTVEQNRIVQATAIELSLAYLSSLQVPEFEDRDVRRSVFLTIWKTIKTIWPSLWIKDSRLVSKVGIFCLTRFIADRISQWADSDDLEIEVTDLDQIKGLTEKMLSHMDAKFWTTPWAERASGGYDTNQGRDRVITALTQLYRNGRRDIAWYTDIDIIDPVAGA